MKLIKTTLTTLAFIAGLAGATPALAADYILVHGAWGGGYSFRAVADTLEAAGHRVYRPSLTGLGDREHLRSADIDLNTHILDIVNLIRFESLDDVILVGHSYAGMVISGVANRLPDRIGRLVFVDAFVPDDGDSAMARLGSRAKLAQQLIQGDYVMPPGRPEPDIYPRNVPQSLATFTQAIELNQATLEALPATYLLTVEAGGDAMVDNHAGDAERARERGWDVVEMTGNHNIQRSQPDALATQLIKVAQAALD